MSESILKVSARREVSAGYSAQWPWTLEEQSARQGQQPCRTDVLGYYVRFLMAMLLAFSVSTVWSQEQPVTDQKNSEVTLLQSGNAEQRKQQVTPFEPTYQVTAESSLLSQAHKVFASSPSPSRGLYRNQGLVFSVVRINCKVEKLRYVEGTAMLRAIAQVRKAFPGLPPRFKVPNRVLENRMDYRKDIYYYTLAIAEDELLRLVSHRMEAPQPPKP